MRNGKQWTFKKSLLLLCSGVLLASGGALLFKSAPMATLFSDHQTLNVTQSPEPPLQPPAHYTPETLTRFRFNADGKDLFSLLVAKYQDLQQQARSAILFPPDTQQSSALANPPDHAISFGQMPPQPSCTMPPRMR